MFQNIRGFIAIGASLLFSAAVLVGCAQANPNVTDAEIIRALSEVSTCDDIEVDPYDGTGIAAYPEPYTSISCSRDISVSVFESAEDLEATARSVCFAPLSGYADGVRIADNAVLTPRKLDAGSERMVPVVLAQLGMEDAPPICP